MWLVTQKAGQLDCMLVLNTYSLGYLSTCPWHARWRYLGRNQVIKAGVSTLILQMLKDLTKGLISIEEQLRIINDPTSYPSIRI
jgi:hypothetical protein